MKQKISVVIFDMDGVIINSEPIWREAEMRVFATHNVYLSEEDCRTTMGLKLDEVINHWNSIYPGKINNPENLKNEIIKEVIHLITLKGAAIQGLYDLINTIQKLGLSLALASSSYMEIINAVLHKLNLIKVFKVVHSAEFELYGKPHPAIYISTLSKLNVYPENAIAIEDSLNGVKSAKSAGIKTICIPDDTDITNPAFSIADYRIQKLQEASGIINDIIS